MQLLHCMKVYFVLINVLELFGVEHHFQLYRGGYFFYCWRKRENPEMWSHTHTTIASHINVVTYLHDDRFTYQCGHIPTRRSLYISMISLVLFYLLWTVGMLHLYVYCLYVYDIACQNFTHIKAIYIYIHIRNLS